jgi:hypothetical protein
LSIIVFPEHCIYDFSKNMFQAVKDFKRRSVQIVLKSVGTREDIVDEEYDTHVIKFHEMMKEMHGCETTLHCFLSQQKIIFSEGQTLTHSVNRIYDINADIERNNKWSGVVNQLQHESQASSLQAKWAQIHETYRSSTAAVCQEYALEPVKAACTRLVPEIDNACKARNTYHVDLQSYHRRLKVLKAKQKDLVDKDKHEKEDGEPTPAALHLEELREKIQHKLNASLDHFKHHNDKTKSEIIAAKQAHDKLMDTLLITTLVCQAELFSQAAAQLQEVVESLPQDRVEEVRQRIADLVSLGGVKTVSREEKTSSSFAKSPPNIPMVTNEVAFTEALTSNDCEDDSEDDSGPWEETSVASRSSTISSATAATTKNTQSQSTDGDRSVARPPTRPPTADDGVEPQSPSWAEPLE